MYPRTFTSSTGWSDAIGGTMVAESDPGRALRRGKATDQHAKENSDGTELEDLRLHPLR